MKKISIIGIGGSGCNIVRTLEENYKFNRTTDKIFSIETKIWRYR